MFEGVQNDLMAIHGEILCTLSEKWGRGHKTLSLMTVMYCHLLTKHDLEVPERIEESQYINNFFTLLPFYTLLQTKTNY